MNEMNSIEICKCKVIVIATAQQLTDNNKNHNTQ